VRFALLGAFVLVLGTLLIGGVLWIASGGAFQKQYNRYLAIEDESVAGLNPNAPVKYNGVDVGMVREIHLDPLNPERVRLVFGIERGTPVNVDTVAVLKTQGLTGIAYVELDGGSPGAPLLKASGAGEYPVIRTKPSLSARLENVLTDVLVKLDGTTTRIDAMLSDENQQSLSATLRDIAAVSHTLAARKDTLDAGLLSAANTFGETERLGVQLGPVHEYAGRHDRRRGRTGPAAHRCPDGAAGRGPGVRAQGADAVAATAGAAGRADAEQPAAGPESRSGGAG